MAAGGFLLEQLLLYVIAVKRLHVSDRFMWIINQSGLLE